MGISAGLIIPNHARAVSLPANQTSTLLGGAKQLAVGVSQNSESKIVKIVDDDQQAATPQDETAAPSYSKKIVSQQSQQINDSSPTSSSTTPAPIVRVQAAPPVLPPTVAPAPSGSVQDRVHAVATQMGYGDAANLSAIDYIVTHESQWNPYIYNQTGSGAYGLFQLMSITPGADVEVQTQTAINYMIGRYGSIQNALAYWQANGNY
jgi:hypothetical protein